jgi:type I restriction enzyme R subunit
MSKPEISGLEILSEEFLLEVQGMKHKNLAIELLKRIFSDELKIRSRTNLVSVSAGCPPRHPAVSLLFISS